METERDYYSVLGVAPTADAAAIEAAYRGRLLRFRVGRFDDRAGALAGPSQAEIEEAYAVLGDPARRAAYDAAHFPAPPVEPKRAWWHTIPRYVRVLFAIWGITFLIAAIVIARTGFRRSSPAQSVIDPGQTPTLVARATASISATPSLAAQATAPPLSPTPAETVAMSPTVALAAPSPTAPATPSPTATSAPSPSPTATPSPPPPSPTATALLPTPTATATAAPPPTIAATEPPPAPVIEPEPEPPPPPAFPATDRIGTTRPVNLRAGPGTTYPTLGALPTGTLLAATGERRVVGGVLWRRFTVPDGRVGWIRDLDVLTVR